MNYVALNVSEDKDNPMPLICFKDIPLYEPNYFVIERGKNSPSTKVSYANLLVRFFNFFEDKYGIQDYREIKREQAIDDFMEDIIYPSVITKEGKKVYLKDAETCITPGTAKQYMNQIQSFYLTIEKPLLELLELDQDYIERLLLTANIKNKIKQNTKYKGIWSTFDLSKLKTLAPNTMWKSKRKEKRSLANEEINVLVHNLKTKSLRDTCIFLCCLECGARISEVLTLQKRHFFKNSNNIWVLGISKSKTKARFVAVPSYLVKLLTLYINTDRRKITGNSLKYDCLFVSTKGKTKGEKISKSTFYKNLKASAKEGGLDAKEIVSHMARAIKATHMKAESKSDEEIKKTLGNKHTINPYIDYNNPDMIVYDVKGLYEFDES